MIKKVLLVVFTLNLASCVSYPVPRYGLSARNANAFKKLNVKIKVSPFTWDKKDTRTSFQCRGAGPIESADKVNFESYIQGAIEDEILTAGMLDDQGKELKINFTYIDVDTAGSANWTFKSVVQFGNSSFEHNSVTKFENAFMAQNACTLAASAFIGGVQDYTSTLVAALAKVNEQKPVKP